MRILRQQKLFFIKLTYAVVLGYLLNTVLGLYKLIPVYYEENTCKGIFEDKSLAFLIVFSVLEFVGLNLLNAFVYYQYYWIKRYEFNQPDEDALLVDAYDNDRSEYIREKIEDDDESNQPCR